jgi:hypothetical protein
MLWLAIAVNLFAVLPAQALRPSLPNQVTANS